MKIIIFLFFLFTACLVEVFVLTPNSITTPNFPEHYDNDLECAVVLTTIQGRRINLQFLEFDVEPSETCFEKDFVQVPLIASNIYLKAKALFSSVICFAGVRWIHRCSSEQLDCGRLRIVRRHANEQHHARSRVYVEWQRSHCSLRFGWWRNATGCSLQLQHRYTYHFKQIAFFKICHNSTYLSFFTVSDYDGGSYLAEYIPKLWHEFTDWFLHVPVQLL